MSRERSYPLLVVERLDLVAREDIALHPELWAVPPVTIEPRPSAETATKPLPVLAFEIDGSDQEDGSAVDGHRDLMHVTGWLKTQDPTNPQGAILELCSDFRRFLDRHRQLEGEDGEPWLVTGQIQDHGYTVVCDFSGGGAGEAWAEFKFDVEFQWSATTA
jgi:hypothetical protein